MKKMTSKAFSKKTSGQKKDVKISFTLMDKALKSSKFTSLSWEEILTTYFNEPLIINKQKREKEANSKNAFLIDVFKIFQPAILVKTLPNGLRMSGSKTAKGSQILIKMYNDDGKDKENTYMFIKKLFIAFSTLPCLENKMLGLPVFAATTTGNPHFLT